MEAEQFNLSLGYLINERNEITKLWALLKHLYICGLDLAPLTPGYFLLLFCVVFIRNYAH